MFNMLTNLKFFLYFIFVYASQSKVLRCQNYICESEKAHCTGFLNATCLCNKEYATFPQDQPLMCNYTRKLQLKALLLELFLSFGAGFYYLERYERAIPKSIICLVCLLMFILFRVFNKNDVIENDDGDKNIDDKDRDVENIEPHTLLVALFGCFFCMIVITWQTIDIILFGLNHYFDNNNQILLGIGD